jgi:hypothetical protein
MRLADILRTLADKMDNIESGSGNDEMAAATQGMDGTEPSSDPLMIPPLQQKLEILKKSAGIDSFYDGGNDELDDIKKLTGIKAVMQNETDDDEPIG